MAHRGMTEGLRRAARLLLAAAFVLVAGACSETQFLLHTAKRVSPADDADRGEPVYKVGNPYQIDGVWYYPSEDYGYDETGIASWYGPKFHGKATANGEVFDMNGLSAAHRTLPLPSYVRVTNLENGRSLVLRINDRGPFARGRILDASRRAAQLLGFAGEGTARVRVRILANESRALAARLKGATTLAKIGSPIIVNSVPKASVSREVIAPPKGGTVASAPKTPPTEPVPPARDGVAVAAGPKLGVVTTGPVTPTKMFVQAGAFAYFDNANRVRAALARIGEVRLTSVMVGGKDLYRVRVGPLADVENADQVLDAVIAAGYPNAQIVID